LKKEKGWENKMKGTLVGRSAKADVFKSVLEDELM